MKGLDSRDGCLFFLRGNNASKITDYNITNLDSSDLCINHVTYCRYRVYGHCRKHRMTIPLTKPQFITVCSIVGIFVLVGSPIYWFEVRPYYVKKRCEHFAVLAAQGSNPINGFELNNTYPGIYEACLNHSGL